MASSQPITGKCVVCGEPASLRCSRCAEGVKTDGSPIAVLYYCGIKCQKKDFLSHKAECRESNKRMKLYRIGALLQEMFFTFRELTFELNILKVENVGSMIVVHEAGFELPAPINWPCHEFKGTL